MPSNQWGELLVKSYSACITLQQNSGNDGLSPTLAMSRKGALDTIRDSRRHVRFPAQSRPRPVVIYLIGQAGVGKSTISNTTFPAMWRELYTSYFPERVENRGTFWVRTPGTEFWDGYEHDLCVLVDDPLYIRDASKAAITFDEIKNMAGDVAFPLTMSAVDDKGMYYFDSPVVIVTMNQTDIAHGVALSDSAAHDRRVDFAYYVTRNGEENQFSLMHSHDGKFFRASDKDTSNVTLVDMAYAALVKYGAHMDGYNNLNDRALRVAKDIASLTPDQERDLLTGLRTKALTESIPLPKSLGQSA